MQMICEETAKDMEAACKLIAKLTKKFEIVHVEMVYSIEDKEVKITYKMTM